MRRIILAVASASLLLTTEIAWADDLTGPVTAIAGRMVTIKEIVLTFPPPAAGQPDPIADMHRGETWSVTYTPGPANTVTKALKEPETGNRD
jgi:hypothetical protein